MKNLKFLQPKPLPFDFEDWKKESFPNRVKLLCTAWATQGYGAPASTYIFYLLKIGFYVFGWLFFCTFSDSLGSISEVSDWWMMKEALLKFVVWSILFEVIGLGCGSGPLTARYFPPFAAIFHFARPGTIKLPFFPKIGDRRNIVDVLLYLVLLASLLRVLIASEVAQELILPVVVLIPLIGILDKTVYLAARSEHYLIALFCFLFVGEEIAALKIVWVAIWWGAATSKLNRHFPSVVAVMISNHGILQWKWLKKKMYRNYPVDLRPSRMVGIMAHMGTVIEYGFPILLILGGGGTATTVGLVIMLLFHVFITSSIPMGVPLEWNQTLGLW